MAVERIFVQEGIKRNAVKEFLRDEMGRAGFGGVEVRRTPIGTRIVAYADRPGIVIGRKGRTIKRMTARIEKTFNVESPILEVQDIENPNLNPLIVAQRITDGLERGWHFRRVGHSAVRRIMEAGARGCQITISGKLRGRRHRTAKFTAGTIKHCGEPAERWMKEGFRVAKLKPGVIGVKVKIMGPEAVLPDEAQEKPEIVAEEIATEKAESAPEKVETETKKAEKEEKPKPKEKVETATGIEMEELRKPGKGEKEKPREQEPEEATDV